MDPPPPKGEAGGKPAEAAHRVTTGDERNEALQVLCPDRGSALHGTGPPALAYSRSGKLEPKLRREGKEKK